MSVLAALAGLALLWWLALVILHHPRLPRPGTLALHDTVSVLQLVFASVAGAGALVALIVAHRRQRIAEADSAHDRTRVLNERFTAIAGQLGDSQAAVRLAGAHAMAGLADDWPENRQTCVDVLCAYLRMPYAAEPSRPADAQDRNWTAWRGFQEVRHTIIRVIAAHLRPDAKVSWRRLNLDFTGVVFDGGDFSRAVFSGGRVESVHIDAAHRHTADIGESQGGALEARLDEGRALELLRAGIGRHRSVFTDTADSPERQDQLAGERFNPDRREAALG